MTCGFCSLEFDATAHAACGACGKLVGGCRVVCCPRCHYEMPEPLKWPRFLERLFGRGHRAAPKVGLVAIGAARERPLADLARGEQGLVVRLDASQPARRKKLLALGILPGARVELERRSPCFVVRLGHSRFALDATVAAAILVTVA